ncbi:dihydrodipicolinate synthase family protein [Paenibacillus sp. BR1-192]|uniref:dihydrodipicolinate synthase family protein n=1 Tax=Paenibacillus sp. BR1-192 TaxID=3032287 RepID=UPI00240D75F2|nr:dihydrodipicolinate synthase family protein [Paenibacillus sp. BR1-192]WFB55754.1 dihydrodipicolinate synthase family protein [Paenibacillus sp. BR1-192]
MNFKGNPNKKFEGVFALLLTPFHEDGSIDWPAYERYVEWQLSFEPQGLFAVCGSSEMKWLSLTERLELMKRTVKLAGKTPVVATGNLEVPAMQEEELKQALGTGIHGVVLVPPPGMGKNQSKLAEHFGRLADIADRPVVLYEWPLVEPYEINPAVYAGLTEQGNVIGIKDTTCTLEGITAKIQAAPDSIVYQANTPFMLEAIRQGAKGMMAVVSAAGGRTVADFWKAASHGSSNAERLHREIVYLDALLRFGYPSSAKMLAALQGIPMGLSVRSGGFASLEAKKALEVWLQSVNA